jgi:hypothetical protein
MQGAEPGQGKRSGMGMVHTFQGIITEPYAMRERSMFIGSETQRGAAIEI